MKNILIDFTRLAEKYGFGEIADNYSQQIISFPDIEEMHFIFLVKEKYKGFAESNVDYVSVEHLTHDLRKLNKKIDLWHSTDRLPEVCKNHTTYFDSYVPEEMTATVKEGIAHWSKDSEEAKAARLYSQSFTYSKYTETYIKL